MLRKLWAWASSQIVTDVPAEISACLDCGQVQCLDSQFRNCPNRLARSASLKAMSNKTASATSARPPVT
ncbi:MAG TPA: hypothetical protein DDZ81_26960 [Acetobacteraceae bacterium]|jgi:hypothetical protein|nr:hypothetical protein [Acetobacteraceae bacterium]